ncbi:Uncharacterized protein HZ326_18243 [Fusarium oxysporum f. sp. albedinis]|nr:Uncharacterized protein HZ326_18243 [Fusarium oxysporum f. sp. albedinis]
MKAVLLPRAAHPFIPKAIAIMTSLMVFSSTKFQTMPGPRVGMKELDLPSSESSLRFSRDVQHISTLDPIVEAQII